MSVVIKTNAMKYKDSNGDYQGFNAIAQESTAQQLADIESAGQTQITAIQQKGAETYASIPDDYTELSDEVTDLKTDIDALEAGKVEIADMVSRYAGRKVSIIGDSISTFTGYQPEGYRPAGYPNAAWGVTKVEETWWMKVIRACGAALEINASWNASCASNARSAKGYPDFYDRRDVLGDPELILVALGTNDSMDHVALGEYDFETAYASLSEATFRTAYIKGAKALQANYPNAEIALVILAMGDSYADSIRTIGQRLGLRVTDARGYHITADTYNVHPDALGMRQIATAALHGVDASLSIGGMPADAATVGAALAARDEAIAGKVDVQQGSGNAGKALVVGSDGAVTTGDAGIPDAVKVALLQLAQHVAYIDDQGQSYYDALYAALYADAYPRIVATYAPGTHVVYTDDSLDTLKPYLTVTYYETAQSSGTAVAANDYTLTGTLVDGESTVVVGYDGLVITVQVEAVDFYNIAHWSTEDNITFLPFRSLREAADGNNIVIQEVSVTSTSYRAGFCCERGQKPLIALATSEPTQYYPIPIPAGATGITVRATDATVKLYAYIFTLDSEGYHLMHSVTGWKTGEQIESFEAGSGKYVVVTTQADTGLTIDFA